MDGTGVGDHARGLLLTATSLCLLMAAARAQPVAPSTTSRVAISADAAPAHAFAPWGFNLPGRDPGVKPGDDFFGYADGTAVHADGHPGRPHLLGRVQHPGRPVADPGAGDPEIGVGRSGRGTRSRSSRSWARSTPPSWTRRRWRRAACSRCGPISTRSGRSATARRSRPCSATRSTATAPRCSTCRSSRTPRTRPATRSGSARRGSACRIATTTSSRASPTRRPPTRPTWRSSCT